MKKGDSRWHIILAILSTILFVSLLIFSWEKNIYWQYDAQAAILATWFFYLMRFKFNLHPLHFFLLILGLSFHGLGVFGLYGTDVLGMEYDFWMHSYFGFVGALILFRALKLKGHVKKEWPKYLLIVLILLGLSTFHEIFEYLGAVFLGQGEGFLYYGTGDADLFDTQKDFVNNFIGMVIALTIYVGYKLFRKVSK